jgi:hypothetical protein
MSRSILLLLLGMWCASAQQPPVNIAWPAIEGLPLDFQAATQALKTSGTIPSFLSGTVFRNGPANYVVLFCPFFFIFRPLSAC